MLFTMLWRLIYQYDPIPICSMYGIFTYIHDWVILFGQMLVCIFQHHGSHMGYHLPTYSPHKNPEARGRPWPWLPPEAGTHGNLAKVKFGGGAG